MVVVINSPQSLDLGSIQSRDGAKGAISRDRTRGGREAEGEGGKGVREMQKEREKEERKKDRNRQRERCPTSESLEVHTGRGLALPTDHDP